MTDKTWKDDAACRHRTDDLFFNTNRQQEALAYCQACPVQKQCLDYALTIPGSDKDFDGIWGGKTAPQVRTMRRKTPHRRRPPLAECGTYAAYRRHYYWGEEPCPPCREANRIYQQQAQEKRLRRRTA